MFDVIKVGLLTWGTLFLMIFAFITLGLWSVCSAWWLLSNHMLDRDTFLLLSSGISLILSLIIIISGLSFDKK